MPYIKSDFETLAFRLTPGQVASSRLACSRRLSWNRIQSAFPLPRNRILIKPVIYNNWLECVDIKAKVNLCFIIICDRHEISALPPLSLCLCSRQLSTFACICIDSRLLMDFTGWRWNKTNLLVKSKWTD